ncbi:MAG: T9SS type A sorting domain-containing protein [Flavobacteriales bacterium]|jgi:hypothetical protein|nr:T9SS type A sorting domain-containing protein [Flavobacteriales bacterium]
MKRLLLSVLALAGLSISGMAQGTNLYVGENYSSTITVYDTTGGSYSVLTTKSLSGGFSGSVNGCYSLSLNPNTQEMYIVYDPGAGASGRRLGILDTISGAVTDIGGGSNLTDIAFYGEELFGTTGNNSGWTFVRVDQTDGSTDLLFSHSPAGDRNCLWANTFSGEGLYKHTGGGGSVITEIDTVTMTESTIITPSPGNVHAGAMKNDSIALVVSSWGGQLYEVNMNTYTWVSVGTLVSSHAMAFNQTPLYVIIDGPTTYCDNDGETTVLASSESATDYQWTMDGSDIDGATDSTYTVMESGVYSCIVDGKETNSVTVTIHTAPTAAFTATPDVIDLGLSAGGAVVEFTNESTSGIDYSWDFDNGFMDDEESPSFPFSIVGTYNVELIVTDPVTGCSDTATNAVEVINTTGLSDLSSQFEIYPTPTEDFVNVLMTSGNNNYTLQLTDLQGRTITEKPITADNKVTFDLSSVEAGVYLIRVFNSSEEAYFKIIKK